MNYGMWSNILSILPYLVLWEQSVANRNCAWFFKMPVYFLTLICSLGYYDQKKTESELANTKSIYLFIHLFQWSISHWALALQCDSLVIYIWSQDKTRDSIEILDSAKWGLCHLLKGGFSPPPPLPILCLWADFDEFFLITPHHV